MWSWWQQFICVTSQVSESHAGQLAMRDLLMHPQRLGKLECRFSLINKLSLLPTAYISCSEFIPRSWTLL